MPRYTERIAHLKRLQQLQHVLHTQRNSELHARHGEPGPSAGNKRKVDSDGGEDADKKRYTKTARAARDQNTRPEATTESPNQSPPVEQSRDILHPLSAEALVEGASGPPGVRRQIPELSLPSKQLEVARPRFSPVEERVERNRQHLSSSDASLATLATGEDYDAVLSYAEERDANVVRNKQLLAPFLAEPTPHRTLMTRRTPADEEQNAVLRYAQERDVNVTRNKQLLASLCVHDLKPPTDPNEILHTDRVKSESCDNTTSEERRTSAYPDSDIDEKPYANTGRFASNENTPPQLEGSTERDHDDNVDVGCTFMSTIKEEADETKPWGPTLRERDAIHAYDG